MPRFARLSPRPSARTDATPSRADASIAGFLARIAARREGPCSTRDAVRARMHVRVGMCTSRPPHLVGKPMCAVCWGERAAGWIPMMASKVRSTASSTARACGSTKLHGMTRES